MTPAGLLVLSRADIVRLMDYSDYVDAVEAAFRRPSKARPWRRPRRLSTFRRLLPRQGCRAFGGRRQGGHQAQRQLPGNPAANALPTVQGIIYLADGVNGRPLAVIDSIEVTINRTGAATTLAARHLARRNSRVATVCGASVQGRIQLTAIAAAVKLDRVHVWDINGKAAERLAQEMSTALKLDVRSALRPFDCAGERYRCHLHVGRRAFCRPAGAAGTFIAAVGADNSDKHEIDPGFMRRASRS